MESCVLSKLGRGVKFLHPIVTPLSSSSHGTSDFESHLIALHKPSGILSHPNSKNSCPRSLIYAPYDTKDESYIINNVSSQRLWLLNRLDSVTSGVILLSSNKEVAQTMNSIFQKRLINKTYIAKVFGKFPPFKELVWQDSMYVNKSDSFVRASSNSGNNRNVAKTIVKYSEMNKCMKQNVKQIQTSLIELNPITGFTHQLRYQCQINGFPIVHDRVYGNFDMNKVYAHLYTSNRMDRIYLHAYNLSFSIHDTIYKFESSIPVGFFE